MPDSRTYRSGQEPDVEVLVDGTWYPGELRAWRRGENVWVATVRWRRGAGQGNHLSSFGEGEVRPG